MRLEGWGKDFFEKVMVTFLAAQLVDGFPSVYWIASLAVLITVQVDDILAVGTPSKLEDFWRRLRQHVVEERERDENPCNRYYPLVCLCDFGAISASVSKSKERSGEDKRKHPALWRTNI